MKSIKKLLAFGMTAVIAVSIACLPAAAASKSDYLQCAEATVTDKGSNTINISGRGKFSTKKDPNNATAAIFKDTIDPYNFKVDLEFLQQYDPVDKTMGWYGIGLTSKPYWLTTSPAIGKEIDYNGIMILFRCDPADKRKVSMEMGWWMGSTVKQNVNNGHFLEPLKSDWKLSVEVKNGKVSVDGKEYQDLSFFYKKLFGDGPVFLSFGALSEKALGTSFNVTYANTAKRDAITMFHNGTLGKDEPPVVSSKPPVTSTVSSAASSTPVTSSAASSAAAASNASSAIISEVESVDSTVTSVTSEAVSSAEAAVSSGAKDAGTAPSKNNAWIWIVIVVIVVLAAAGVIVFFVLKKKNGTAK